MWSSNPLPEIGTAHNDSKDSNPGGRMVAFPPWFVSKVSLEFLLKVIAKEMTTFTLEVNIVLVSLY